MGAIFDELEQPRIAPVGSYPLPDTESVWDAIRAFFHRAGRCRELTKWPRRLARLTRPVSRLSRASQGLDYYPVQFEEVPASFMMEVAVYGLPVRMPHWSFGVRYIYQLIQHRMGHSRLFEVVFPGQPGPRLSRPEQLAAREHAGDRARARPCRFREEQPLFSSSQEQVGYRIVDQAAAHARQIGEAIAQHGQERVEAVLDAALALEASYRRGQARCGRERYPETR